MLHLDITFYFLHSGQMDLRFFVFACLFCIVSGGIVFENTGSQGLSSYARIPSPELQAQDDALPQPDGLIPLQNILGFGGFGSAPDQEPIMGWNVQGTPGIAIFDFDNDGDEDFYVTNGPSRNNSLFVNQFKETGSVSWIDIAGQSGVGLFDKDNTGACAGDLNNDGWTDLIVLSRNHASNHVFLNQGDGTFRDVSVESGFGLREAEFMSCALGDLDNDGFLDVVITTNVNFTRFWYACFLFPDAISDSWVEPNQVLLNVFHNETSLGFVDITADTPLGDSRRLTWSVTLLDYDYDGNVDVITASTNCAGDYEVEDPTLTDHGFISFFKNLGGLQFEDLTPIATSNGTFDPRIEPNKPAPGDWKGLSWGSYNNDIWLDVMATNFGNNDGGDSSREIYEKQRSRWFLQDPETHLFPDLGGCFRTNPDQTEPPFDISCGTDHLNGSGSGWISMSIDYDADGDTDILYFGSQKYLDWTSINAGTVLSNPGDSSARMEFEWEPLELWRNQEILRETHAGGHADFNNDGFPDIALVSARQIPAENAHLVENFIEGGFLPPTGSPFDNTTYIYTTWGENNTISFLPVYYDIGQNGPYEEGNVVVLMNNADSNNKPIRVRVVGTKGITNSGKMNRDGIGAIIQVKPLTRSLTQTLPVMAGEATHSQSSLIRTFGTDHLRSARIDVFFPNNQGGTWNRHYSLLQDEIVFPEIPCSFKDKSQSLLAYKLCVTYSLHQIVNAGIIKPHEGLLFEASALLAWFDT